MENYNQTRVYIFLPAIHQIDEGEKISIVGIFFITTRVSYSREENDTTRVDTNITDMILLSFLVVATTSF